MKKITCALLAATIILLSFVSCSNNDDDYGFASIATTGTTSGDFVAGDGMYVSESNRKDFKLRTEDSSEFISVGTELAKEFQNDIKAIKLDTVYNEIFQTDEAYKRIFADAKVTHHDNFVLDENGELSAARLFDCVKKNNLGNTNSAREEIPDNEIMNVCEMIVDTVEKVFAMYPDIDRDRVYCNLSHLSMFHNIASVSYASVSPDMVLDLSLVKSDINKLINGDTGVYRTLAHETMHMMQIGCSCENLEHVTRRCGVAIMWDDFDINSTDFSWLFESSAEYNMSRVTGLNLMTYKNMVGYLRSFDLVSSIRDDVPDDYVASISFYDDVNKLFDMLNCETKEERYEAINTIMCIELMQQAPKPVVKAYCDHFGLDETLDETKETMNYALKPFILKYFTKQFYYNFIEQVAKGKLTADDICYMIELFELDCNIHINYANKKTDEINEFLDFYKEIRSEFFSCVKEGSGFDLEAYYNDYTIYDEEAKICNAAFTKLSEQRRAHLVEMLSYLYGRDGFLEHTLQCKIK